jgi:endogenous inhibitor of DNA gyrase (YacG/DUF329 family)
MTTQKTKKCARCGLEFTFERSTKKFCGETCRRAYNIKAQRKREKRNTERCILRDLKNRWRSLQNRIRIIDDERFEVMYDAEGGCSFSAEKLEQLDRTREAMKPYWDRDERMIRADAEKVGIEWSKITGEV